MYKKILTQFNSTLICFVNTIMYIISDNTVLMKEQGSHSIKYDLLKIHDQIQREVRLSCYTKNNGFLITMTFSKVYFGFSYS